MPFNHTSKSSKLTDKQFELIGKLLLEFSNLDYIIGILLNRLLITPEYLGLTYNDQLTVMNKITALENAIELHRHRYDYRIIPEPILNDLTELVQKVKGIKTLRNKFAHNLWSRWSDEKIFGTKLTGKLVNYKKPNRDSITITNTELNKHYEQAYELVEKASDLLDVIPKFEENIELIKKTIK